MAHQNVLNTFFPLTSSSFPNIICNKTIYRTVIFHHFFPPTNTAMDFLLLESHQCPFVRTFTKIPVEPRMRIINKFQDSKDIFYLGSYPDLFHWKMLLVVWMRKKNVSPDYTGVLDFGLWLSFFGFGFGFFLFLVFCLVFFSLFFCAFRLGLARTLAQIAFVKSLDISGLLGVYANRGRWIQLPKETFHSNKYFDSLNL